MTQQSKSKKTDARRFGKESHEDSWDPYLVWQILRRTPSYKQAVNEFRDSANKANDHAALSLFKKISSSKKMVKRSTIKEPRKYIRDNINQTRDFNQWTKRPLSIWKKLDTSTKHYQKFIQWYGDILLFPIDPTVDTPNDQIFESVWVFKPATIPSQILIEKIEQRKVSRLTPTSEVLEGNLILLNWVVNKNFSKAQIKRHLNRLVDETMNSASNENERPHMAKVPWSNLEDILITIDLINNQSGEYWGQRKIGTFFAPRLDEESRRTKGQGLLRAADNLLKVFERKRPIQK